MFGCGGSGNESISCADYVLVAVEPSSTRARINKSVSINVSVNSSVGIFAVGFTLTFNASLLNCTNASGGVFLGLDGAGTFSIIRINNTAGSVGFAATRVAVNTTIAGYGSILQLSFLPASAGMSPINLEKLMLTDNAPSMIGNAVSLNGTVSVE